MTNTSPHHDGAASPNGRLKLWLLSADTRGYEVYKSAVVAAASEREARHIHPRKTIGIVWNDEMREWMDAPVDGTADYSWAATPDHVKAVEIGTAAPGVEAGVINASFLNG